MWNDLCVAARQLAKQRTFTLAAVVALAIGMSATTTMFTIIHGVYFRVLPFADQEDRCLNEPLDVITIGRRRRTGKHRSLSLARGSAPQVVDTVECHLDVVSGGASGSARTCQSRGGTVGQE